IVFMAIANVHFDEYLLVRKNLLISSKSIKPDSLDTILGDILKYPAEGFHYESEPDFWKQFDNRYENIGRKNSFISYGPHWADVS
ncbi:hypothetical protein ONR49_25170, partial [Salmonella enterica subsp. enterica serovar Virginia]|nr:hypothetical protein [Salmonella enterica subsp. enterica serovar Virginia]